MGLDRGMSIGIGSDRDGLEESTHPWQKVLAHLSTPAPFIKNMFVPPSHPLDYQLLQYLCKLHCLFRPSASLMIIIRCGMPSSRRTSGCCEIMCFLFGAHLGLTWMDCLTIPTQARKLPDLVGIRIFFKHILITGKPHLGETQVLYPFGHCPSSPGLAGSLGARGDTGRAGRSRTHFAALTTLIYNRVLSRILFGSGACSIDFQPVTC